MRYLLMLHNGEHEEIEAASDDIAIEKGTEYSKTCHESIEVARRIALCDYDWVKKYEAL